MPLKRVCHVKDKTSSSFKIIVLLMLLPLSLTISPFFPLMMTNLNMSMSAFGGLSLESRDLLFLVNPENS